MTTQTLKNWHRVKLEEIANFEYGYTASAKDVDTGVKLLRITDIVPELIDWDTVPFCEINEQTEKQFEIKKGDILIARTGATAGYAKLIRNQPKKSVFASYLIRLTMKNAEARPEYVGRIVESDIFKQFVTTHAGGAAQPHANAPVLKNFELLLPGIETQAEIVDVLSGYDDLIENNARRIQILEQIAQATYTEWFVNFRFSGHEKIKMIDSGTEFGKIPEGWEVLQVKDIIQRVSPGKLYDNKTVSPKGKVPVLDQGRSGIIGYHNDEPGVMASIEKPVIVFANHTCYQRLMLFPFSAIQNVLPFYPSEEKYRNIFWLHFATKDLIKFNDYKGHWPEFMQKKLVVPTAEITDKFAETINPHVILSYQLGLANHNLRQTRDLLLPKLVTGEIRV